MQVDTVIASLPERTRDDVEQMNDAAVKVTLHLCRRCL